jgi:hypothetical protein
MVMGLLSDYQATGANLGVQEKQPGGMKRVIQFINPSGIMQNVKML